MVEKTMKYFFIICCLFISSSLGATTTTYTFGDTTKTLTNTSNWQPEKPWSNLTTTKCKQRYYGVGIGSITDSRSMGMCATFEEAIPLQMVTITCYASSQNATGKIVTLSVTGLFNDGKTESAACIFETTTQSTEQVPAPYTLTFTFQSTALLSQLAIKNESADDCYLEIGSVSFHRTTPKIEATIDVAERLFAGTTASASVVSLEGGDGIYEDYTFCWFLNEEPTNEEDFFIAQTLREPFSFVVPEEEGEYSVTFRVIDTKGNITDTSATFKSDVQAPPSNINITHTTRTGFDLSWEVNGPIAPEAHRVRLAIPETIETTYAPTWIESENGEVVTTLDLTMFSENVINGLTALKFTTTATLETPPLYSFDTIHWQTTVSTGDYYHIFNFTEFQDKECFYLKLSKNYPTLKTLDFIFEADEPPLLFDKTYVADGHHKTVSFSNLPSGKNCRLTIDAIYADEETKSITQLIQLPTMDPFVKIQKWENFFYFTWPNDETIKTGMYTLYANIPTERQGVFLTRLFHATGDLGGKGIVLTNTTNESIDLSSYTLQYTRPTGKTVDWVMEDQILDAKSEVIFVYPGAKIDLPSDVKEISTTAMNFTNGGVLTLYNGNEIVNSLHVKSKHITRLNASTQGETFTAYTDDSKMENLWSIWIANPISTTLQLQTQSLSRESSTTQKTIDCDELRSNIPIATAFWIEAYTIEGENISDALKLSIWEQPLPSTGYLLRLR